MPGRASRQKGNRAERETVRLLQAAGFVAEKVSRTGYAGSDVSIRLLGRDRRAEVKIRRAGFKQLYGWLDTADLLIIRVNHNKPLIVTPFCLAIEIAKAAENSRKRVSSAPDAASPANRAQEAPLVMTSESKNALTTTPIVDGFDDTGDASASPLRGISLHFNPEIKEANKYIGYSEPFPVKGRTFAVIDKRDGWQKLAEGCPPEYLMREPGKLRPPRPHIAEEDWPAGFNGKPEHPFKWTLYLRLVDTATGEISTFWSNTVGGKIAFEELSDQVKFMRSMHPGKIPVAIIALESTLFPTSYGSKKARPLFKIVGYKWRDQIGLGAQNLLTDGTKAPLVEAEKPSLAEEMNDEIPDLGAKAAEAPKQKRSKK
jgi:hypothetical protein